MSAYFAVVFEKEATGAVAFIPGLPLYAAADTRRQAAKAIRELLAAYLVDHPDTVPTGDIAAVRVH